MSNSRYTIIDDEQEEVPAEQSKNRYRIVDESEQKNGLPFFATKAPSTPLFGINPENISASQNVPGAEVSGLKRGGMDIAEGLKQLFLRGKEADQYTKEVEARRKSFESSPANQTLGGQVAREAVGMLPYAPLAAIGGIPSIIGRILAGGVGTAAIRGTQFMPEETSRPIEMAKAGVAGGVLSALPEAPELISKISSKIARPFKVATQDIKPLQATVESLQADLEKAGLNKDEAKVAAQMMGEKSQEETGAKSVGALKHQRKEAAKGLMEEEPTESQLHPMPSTHESQARVETAEDASQTAHENLGEAEQNISEHLNVGADHDVNAAAQILSARERIREKLSKGYDALKTRFAKKNVVINNTQAIQDANNNLINITRESAKRGIMGGKEAEQALLELQRLQLHPDMNIPADQYLSAIKSAKDYAREARHKAFEPDMNEADRVIWRNKYDELDNAIEEMEGHLEKGVGKKEVKKLKELNAGWRTQVKPLQRNSTYQTIRKRGRINNDIMTTLRGTDPGDVLMRETIKSNPDILRNVVGQRYAENPSALHTAGQRENEYINQMPQLREMINRHHEANTEAMNARHDLQQAEAHHERTVKQAIGAKKQQEAEASKIQLSKEKQQELRDKIAIINHHIDNLQKAISTEKTATGAVKRITPEVQKARVELKKAMAERDKMRSIIRTGVVTAIGSATGLTGLRYINKLFSGKEE